MVLDKLATIRVPTQAIRDPADRAIVATLLREDSLLRKTVDIVV